MAAVQKMRWQVRKVDRNTWEGYLEIPTTVGLPIGVSARAYTPRLAHARTMAVAKQVAKSPGLSAMLPPQAKMALSAAKVALPIVKNLGKKALSLFKSIF
jgi:hypothetical protein